MMMDSSCDLSRKFMALNGNEHHSQKNHIEMFFYITQTIKVSIKAVEGMFAIKHLITIDDI